MVQTCVITLDMDAISHVTLQVYWNTSTCGLPLTSLLCFSSWLLPHKTQQHPTAYRSTPLNISMALCICHGIFTGLLQSPAA